jgi:hypothetical protein
MATTRPPEVVVVEEDAPAHDPGLVLRSQYAFVRALLGVALAAVAVLTVAVVILASSEHGPGAAQAFASPVESIEYGGFNPGTGRPDSAPPAPRPTHD